MSDLHSVKKITSEISQCAFGCGLTTKDLQVPGSFAKSLTFWGLTGSQQNGWPHDT